MCEERRTELGEISKVVDSTDGCDVMMAMMKGAFLIHHLFDILKEVGTPADTNVRNKSLPATVVPVANMHTENGGTQLMSKSAFNKM